MERKPDAYGRDRSDRPPPSTSDGRGNRSSDRPGNQDSEAQAERARGPKVMAAYQLAVQRKRAPKWSAAEHAVPWEEINPPDKTKRETSPAEWHAYGHRLRVNGGWITITGPTTEDRANGHSGRHRMTLPNGETAYDSDAAALYRRADAMRLAEIRATLDALRRYGFPTIGGRL